MYQGDLIGATESCTLLGISRTTLRSYRKKYNISEIKVKREVKFSKLEILNKLYTVVNPFEGHLDLSMYSAGNFDSFKIDKTSYDLRRLDCPDGHGAISLICHLITEIKNGKKIHLLIGKENIFLKEMNFFGVLKMYLNSSIFWSEEVFDSIPLINYTMIKMPIKKLGIVGAHNSIIDDLTVSLSKQGYSMDICSYIGWAIGELADNAATHAKVSPSFFYFEQFGEDRRYLQLTIGDTGIGIPKSLRKNINYIDYCDSQALVTAFKPNVSGRPDEEDRGKGLTDVIKIAMECGSKLRVESNNVGYEFSFNSGKDNFQSKLPLFSGQGTIISILFIDGTFASLEREDVGSYIDSCLEKIWA